MINLDKFHARTTTTTPNVFPPTTLTQFLGEMGWYELWRSKFPFHACFLCHTSGRNTLSRIDYICGNARACAVVGDIQYLPRAVSDHSPELAEFLILNVGGTQCSLQINPFWLFFLDPGDRITDQLVTFLESNSPTHNQALVWDTFKAYLRGCLKSSISYVKRESSRFEEELSTKCSTLEAVFINNPSDESRCAWLQEGRQYLIHLQEKACRS